MGHYLACRYYGIDATLPFFLPMPLSLTGTLGAVIRIRQPISDKRALFDIGIAGPIAGFLVAVPALFFGLHLSTRASPVPRNLRRGCRARRATAVQGRGMAGLGHRCRTATRVNMHPDGFRGVVRPAGDRAQPVSRSRSSTAATSRTPCSAGARHVDHAMPWLLVALSLSFVSSELGGLDGDCSWRCSSWSGRGIRRSSTRRCPARRDAAGWRWLR